VEEERPFQKKKEHRRASRESFLPRRGGESFSVLRSPGQDDDKRPHLFPREGEGKKEHSAHGQKAASKRNSSAPFRGRRGRDSLPKPDLGKGDVCSGKWRADLCDGLWARRLSLFPSREGKYVQFKSQRKGGIGGYLAIQELTDMPSEVFGLTGEGDKSHCRRGKGGQPASSSMEGKPRCLDCPGLVSGRQSRAFS